MENRIITEFACKSQGCKPCCSHVLINRVWPTKNLCLNHKVLHAGAGKVIEADIVSEVTMLRETDNWFLLHENIPAHSSTSEVLPGKLWCDHSPGTPTSAPANSYLSPQVKNCSHTKILRCQVIKQNITAEWNVVCLDAFKVCSAQVSESYDTCHALKSGYI
jgi:hypothetical protein